MSDEFGFINNLKEKYGLSKIGDDCAVLPKNDTADLVMTSDMLVEDIDFRLIWTTPEMIGHKALAVSLSDVAAMGATPVWSMVSIGIPKALWEAGFGEQFYEGYMTLASRFGVTLIGGDISRTDGKLVVDSTVAGEVQKGRAVLRSGARPGDIICVTGELGGAATALGLLENGERFGTSLFDELLLRQLAPTPRVEIGKYLCGERLATAMIDVSDGLVADLSHICEASGVGASLNEWCIPTPSPIDDRTPDLTLSDAEKNIFYGGEDFELLFTVDPEIFLRVENEFRERLISMIGTVTTNTGIIELNSWRSKRILNPEGYRHF